MPAQTGATGTASVVLGPPYFGASEARMNAAMGTFWPGGRLLVPLNTFQSRWNVLGGVSPVAQMAGRFCQVPTVSCNVAGQVRLVVLTATSKFQIGVVGVTVQLTLVTLPCCSPSGVGVGVGVGVGSGGGGG